MANNGSKKLQEYKSSFDKYTQSLENGIFPGGPKGTIEEQTDCFENFLQASIEGKENGDSVVPYLTEQNGKSCFGTQNKDTGTVKLYDSNGKASVMEESVKASKGMQAENVLSESLSKVGLDDKQLGE